MKITFVLPGAGQNPSGGFKVVYEYANRMAKRGHDVCVVHPAYVGAAKRLNPIRVWRKVLTRYLTRLVMRRWRPLGWFNLDSRVRMAWVPFLHPIFVPDADVVVATLWLTAERIVLFPDGKGRKYYLVQGLETWGGGEQRVMATWRAPMRKIVISQWLADIATGLGEDCVYIPNGLDFERFGCDSAIEDRQQSHVGMLYHAVSTKGSLDGVMALKLAKQLVPELTAELFGVVPAPGGLPDWIKYHHNPAQDELRRLYNRCAVFISPSWEEGWGLTALEAMSCGAAVAVTDIGGHREFAIPGQTALLSPPREPQALADNIVKLVVDEQLRHALGKSGLAHVKQFSWEYSVNRFEDELLDVRSDLGSI